MTLHAAPWIAFPTGSAKSSPKSAISTHPQNEHGLAGYARDPGRNPATAPKHFVNTYRPAIHTLCSALVLQSASGEPTQLQPEGEWSAERVQNASPGRFHPARPTAVVRCSTGRISFVRISENGPFTHVPLGLGEHGPDERIDRCPVEIGRKHSRIDPHKVEISQG
jgi:hypothetical protein